MVFIDPEAGTRASAVLALAYKLHLAISARDTCFGLILEGERGVVRNLLSLLRDEFRSGLYFKRRPFSISDTKVCARTFNRLGLRRAAEQYRFHNIG